jgi:hypothetical protein
MTEVLGYSVYAVHSTDWVGGFIEADPNIQIYAPFLGLSRWIQVVPNFQHNRARRAFRVHPLRPSVVSRDRGKQYNLVGRSESG